jgi:hypothetical protein
MSEVELTQRQLLDQLDTMLATAAKLADQIIAMKRKVEGVNPVREVLAFYDELWVSRYSAGAKPPVRYEFNRTIDPATVKRWLKTMDVLVLKGRITRYFADRDAFLVRHKHPFNLFIKNFNTYAPPANQGASVASSPEPVPQCSHVPPCGTDAEHTRRRMEDMRAVEP